MRPATFSSGQPRNRCYPGHLKCSGDFTVKTPSSILLRSCSDDAKNVGHSRSRPQRPTNACSMASLRLDRSDDGGLRTLAGRFKSIVRAACIITIRAGVGNARPVAPPPRIGRHGDRRRTRVDCYDRGSGGDRGRHCQDGGPVVAAATLHREHTRHSPLQNRPVVVRDGWTLIPLTMNEKATLTGRLRFIV